MIDKVWQYIYFLFLYSFAFNSIWLTRSEQCVVRQHLLRRVFSTTPVNLLSSFCLSVGLCCLPDIFVSRSVCLTDYISIFPELYTSNYLKTSKWYKIRYWISVYDSRAFSLRIKKLKRIILVSNTTFAEGPFSKYRTPHFQNLLFFIIEASYLVS